jgi:hypothetical protein
MNKNKKIELKFLYLISKNYHFTFQKSDFISNKIIIGDRKGIKINYRIELKKIYHFMDGKDIPFHHKGWWMAPSTFNEYHIMFKYYKQYMKL